MCGFEIRIVIVATAFALSSCFGPDDEQIKLPSGFANRIAICGAGLESVQAIATEARIGLTGGSLSISRRSTLRAAFIDALSGDVEEAVVAYTEYVSCITLETEREYVLSTTLERKIAYLAWMSEQRGFSEADVREVAELYDKEYGYLSAGRFMQARDTFGALNRRLAELSRIRNIGFDLDGSDDPSFVPPPLPPPPPPPPSSGDYIPPSEAEVRKRDLRRLARLTETVTQFDDAYSLCLMTSVGSDTLYESGHSICERPLD